MTNIKHGTRKLNSAAEYSDRKATAKEGEKLSRTCSDQEVRDYEAAQHPAHATQIHTDGVVRGEMQTIRKSITKSDWLAAQGCTAQAWFALRAKRTVPSEAGLFRMEQGREIGALARELFPGGIIVSNLGMETAAQVTAELLDVPSTGTLFEA